MSEAGSSTPYNYPSNSNKKKEEASAAPKKTPSNKPEMEKIISGEVVQRKKPLGKRIAETFTGDDTRNVGNYILFEVILPAAKNMIADAFSQGIERMLFGSEHRRPGATPGRPGYTSYNRVSTQNRPDPRSMSSHARATHKFDDILFGDRVEANEVLDKLVDTIDQYDVVSVADLLSLVGISGSFQDEKWGWYDLRSGRVQMVRGGYVLVLPKPQPIE